MLALKVHYSMFLSSAISGVLALNNGLAKTPAMGWNPYNAFGCSTTEADYHAAASNLVSLGFKDLGYEYLILDSGWQGTNRTSSGNFTWNNTTLPSGVPALATYAHNLGLKFGVYSDGGSYSCDCDNGHDYFLGSLGYETQDAETFASWGADYLKYDNCYSVSSTDFVDYDPPTGLMQTHYTTMRNALEAVARPILFSMCEWGLQDVARWASSVGNSWRMSNDVSDGWSSLFRIINEVVPITQFAAPGGFNDLDLLEVGNSGMTVAEQQTQFGFWAAAKSPLLISTDLTQASNETLAILSNKNIIAVNQDSLGQSISFKRRYTNDHDVWAGPLSDGSTVVVLINWQDTSNSITFSLADVGFSSATATNLYTGESLGKITTSYTSTFAAHGSLVLKLTNATAAPTPTFKVYEASSTVNTLAGVASPRVVNSSITVVGYIGGGAVSSGGGTLTFNNVSSTTSGTKLLSFDYFNGDFTMYDSTPCANCRNANVSVNGGEAVQVQMPVSAMTWDIPYTGYLVSLSGFVAGDTNTIEFSSPADTWAPDMWRIGIQD